MLYQASRRARIDLRAASRSPYPLIQFVAVHALTQGCAR